jgi:predicted nucleic acid-binding Zn ribbon protein
MRIFEYECEYGHIHEWWTGYDIKVARTPPKHMKCPECGEKMNRKFSPSQFVLKGEGFHANDYKGK